MYANAEVWRNLFTQWTKTMCTYMRGSVNTDFVWIRSSDNTKANLLVWIIVSLL